MLALVKTVRVFISSTFRDMHAERDHLMRVVFPELEQRCMARGLPFVPVDLRWGVTQEEAESGETLGICLQEIEDCRPFFICLLGARFGWIPLPPTVAEEFADRLTGEDAQLFREAYQENAGYHEYLLRSERQRRETWGEESQGKTEQLLVALVAFGVPTAGQSITAQEINHGVLNDLEQQSHSLFYFRKPQLTKTLAADKPDDFFEPTHAGRQKLAKLKCAIRRAGLHPQRYADLETFGNLVLKQLWERITLEFPDEHPVPTDLLAEERLSQELFVRRLTGFFIGRKDVLAQLNRLVAESDGYIAVTGPSGCGKTALLANWLYGHEGFATRHPDIFSFCHFIGADTRSANAREILYRFCSELLPIAGWTKPLPQEFDKLSTTFPILLEAAAKRQPILIVVDALDQLEQSDNAHTLCWLPINLPADVTIIASSLSEDEHQTWSPLQTRAGKRVLNVPLCTKSVAQEMIVKYLAQYRKRLSHHQLAVLLEKQEIGSPLYLQVVLNELLTFGDYEGVTAYLRALPETIPAMYVFVLEHLEHEHEHAFVERVMACLSCGRYGMTEQELIMLTETEGGSVTPRKWVRLYRILSSHLLKRGETLGFYHRQLREAVERRYLQGTEIRRRTHWDIAWYFKGQPLTNKRKLEELPWQQTQAQDAAGLERTLTDLDFIEAKCLYRMANDLVRDYIIAGAGCLVNGLPIITAALQHHRYGLLCPYCRSWSELPEGRMGQEVKCPVCIRLLRLNSFAVEREWTPTTVEPDRKLGQPVGSQTPSRRVQEFADFVTNRLHVLTQYPQLTKQEAVNWRDGTAPHETAQYGLSTICLRLLNKDAQQDACLLTIQTGAGSTGDCIFFPNGEEFAACLGKDGLLIGDARTGEELARLSGDGRQIERCAHASAGHDIAFSSWVTFVLSDRWNQAKPLVLSPPEFCINAFALMPNGQHVLFAGHEGGAQQAKLALFDIASGDRLCSFPVEGYSADCCMVSPDGRQIACMISGELVGLWDSATGRTMAMLAGHRFGASSCAFSPDGTRLLSTAVDGMVRIWDVESAAEIHRLPGPQGGTTVSAFSPDGKHIVVGFRSGNLWVWDAVSGERIGLLRGHTDKVTGCTYSPDGERILTLSSDGSLKIWSVKAMATASMPTNQYPITAIAYSPTASHVVTAATDGMLRLLAVKQRVEIASQPAYHNLDWGKWVAECVYAPDGRQVAAVCDDGTLTVWDTTANLIQKLETHVCYNGMSGTIGSPRGCRFAPSGNRLASRHDDGCVKLWSGNPLVASILHGHIGNTSACAWSPDGRLLVVASFDQTLTVWNTETLCKVRTLDGHQDFVTHCAFSPDGVNIVSAGSDRDRKVLMWEVGADCLPRLCVEHPDGVNACLFSPDGGCVVSSSQNSQLSESHRETLINFDLSEFRTTWRLDGCSILRSTQPYSPDGRYLLCQSQSRTLLIVDTVSGEVVTRFVTGYDLKVGAFSPHGEAIILGDAVGTLYFLSPEGLHPGSPVTTAYWTPGKAVCHFGCPLCRMWSEISKRALGTEAPCPTCGRLIRLNPFVIEANWRQFVAAWQ